MSLVWGMLSIASWPPMPDLTDGKGLTLQIRSMVLSKTCILKMENLYLLVEAPGAAL